MKWRIRLDILGSKIEDEYVILSMEGGHYYTLDPVASSIWELLNDHPASTEELTDILTDEYDVSREQCMTDVQSFIDEMASNKLIEGVSD